MGMSSPLGMLPKKEEKRKKERYVAAGSGIKPNTPYTFWKAESKYDLWL